MESYTKVRCPTCLGGASCYNSLLFHTSGGEMRCPHECPPSYHRGITAMLLSFVVHSQVSERKQLQRGGSRELEEGKIYPSRAHEHKPLMDLKMKTMGCGVSLRESVTVLAVWNPPLRIRCSGPRQVAKPK